MYGLNRLNSANQLVTLFTGAAYPKWLFCLNPPLRSISCTHFDGRPVIDPPSPAATAGIDDFLNVGEGDKIPGGDDVALLENESGSNDSKNTYERKVLPPELSRSAVMLKCESSADGGVCDVYLVGTIHVSTESCREVQAVIEFLKPQVVFLELCPSREDVLTAKNFKVPTMAEMIGMWMENENPFGILCGWFLAKIASKLGVMPGAEFRVAYEEAMKYGGKVILGDRPVQITLQRTWSMMPIWHKTKLVYSFLFQSVFLPRPRPRPANLTNTLKETEEKMDDADMVKLVIQKMSKSYPTLVETLVYERDQYMSAELLKVARERNSVVAVVGKAHVPGIQKYWEQPIDMKQLLSIPVEKKRITVSKILSSVGATVAGVAIISGIYLSIKK